MIELKIEFVDWMKLESGERPKFLVDVQVLTDSVFFERAGDGVFVCRDTGHAFIVECLLGIVFEEAQKSCEEPLFTVTLKEVHYEL